MAGVNPAAETVTDGVPVGRKAKYSPFFRVRTSALTVFTLALARGSPEAPSVTYPLSIAWGALVVAMVKLLVSLSVWAPKPSTAVTFQ